MFKRTGAIVLSVAFLSLAIAPETLAHNRYRRAGFYRPAAVYYRPHRVVRTRFYTQRYYTQPYYRRVYYTPYVGVAGTRYYSQRYYSRPYYAGNGYYGQRYYRRNSTRNLVLSTVVPAAVGAGIGALAGGKKGAGIGALVGGGGGALFYLLRNRSRRY